MVTREAHGPSTRPHWLFAHRFVRHCTSVADQLGRRRLPETSKAPIDAARMTGSCDHLLFIWMWLSATIRGPRATVPAGCRRPPHRSSAAGPGRRTPRQAAGPEGPRPPAPATDEAARRRSRWIKPRCSNLSIMRVISGACDSRRSARASVGRGSGLWPRSRRKMFYGCGVRSNRLNKSSSSARRRS